MMMVMRPSPRHSPLLLLVCHYPSLYMIITTMTTRPWIWGAQNLQSIDNNYNNMFSASIAHAI